MNIGEWLVEQSDCEQYLYVSRTDKPGQIHIKADDEAYVADIWTYDGTADPKCIAGTTALYSELGEPPMNSVINVGEDRYLVKNAPSSLCGDDEGEDCCFYNSDCENRPLLGTLSARKVCESGVYFVKLEQVK